MRLWPACRDMDTPRAGHRRCWEPRVVPSPRVSVAQPSGQPSGAVEEAAGCWCGAVHPGSGLQAAMMWLHSVRRLLTPRGAPGQHRGCPKGEQGRQLPGGWIQWP